MRLKQKIAIGAVLLAAVPLIISSAIIISDASSRSKEALQESSKERLVSVRDLTKGRIEDYFIRINKQIRTFSQGHTAIEAMKSFKQSFASYQNEIATDNIEALRSELGNYYRNEFAIEHSARNQGDKGHSDEWLRQLDANSVVLQHTFIRANSHALGEKDKLIDPKDGTSYADDHSEFHPIFKAFLEEFFYYDIFLIDHETGDVVYSVFKELDYATSLKSGPFSNSGLGEAFKRANQAVSPGAVIMTDLAPYPPSYMDPAAFIASPIFDQGRKIGVLVFQIPIGDISRVITHNGEWEKHGLGKSGETYLVGEDGLMRSDSRFLLEDQSGYLDALTAGGMPTDRVKLIEAKNTSMGLQTVDSEGSRAALSGQSGFKIFTNYHNVPVLSAYTPLSIEGVKWALLAEMDQKEAFHAAALLTTDLEITATVVVLVMLSLAAMSGIWFSFMLSKPITKLSRTISEIESNADLTMQVEIKSKDELGATADAFNSMLRKFRSSLQKVSDATVRVASTAEETSVITEQTNNAIQQQLSESEQTATAMTEMSSTIQEVSNNTNNTAQSSNEVAEQAANGQQTMGETIEEIKLLAKEVEHASKVIQQLEKHSEEIGSVLDVIKGIAEQTNLLALNAAIEAARAGEQGRGFAVVADEVRNLASKTQSSTEEINQMIEKLQSGSRQAVSVMSSSQNMAQSAAEQATQTGEAFASITQAIGNITEMSMQIAGAVEEQSTVANEINRSVVQINEMTQQTASGTEQTATASNDLTILAADLRELVEQFKL